MVHITVQLLKQLVKFLQKFEETESFTDIARHNSLPSAQMSLL